MSRFGNGDEEYLYDAMFSADIRQRDEEVKEWASESAHYLNDLKLGKHVEPNFNYDDYVSTT